jgi:hypothetical protein
VSLEPAATRLRRLLDEGTLDEELGALLWLLGERGVPLVVATREPDGVRLLSKALPGVSGALAAESLGEVARLGGGSASVGLPDELRDLGVLIVLGRVAGRLRATAVHYVRPLERDAGGHVQRRGPAVLAAWDEPGGRFEHFAWGVEAELAERSGLALPDFTRQLDERLAALRAG